jgi:hypothetical protein
LSSEGAWRKWADVVPAYRPAGRNRCYDAHTGA